VSGTGWLEEKIKAPAPAEAEALQVVAGTAT
jgi:hypothetical protein